MPSMTMLTFADLMTATEAKLARARDTASIEHWNLVKNVIAGVAGEDATDEFDPAQSGGTWWLTDLSVSGLRGVPSTGLSVTFPPTPGITVIHGANGSGKSSLTSAMDIGLHGAMDASIERRSGSGGNLHIWEPVLLNAESSQARVAITLSSSEGSRLKVETLIGGANDAEITATLESSGTSRQVELGPKWRSALRAYGPVHAYSAWEQYIQTAGDLQKYLKRMLVLGGCFEAVQGAIDDGARDATAAAEQLKGAKQRCEMAIKDSEALFSRQCTIQLPDHGDDPDAWWTATGLPEPRESSGHHGIEVDLGELQRSAEKAAEVVKKLGDADDVQSVALFEALDKLRGVPHDMVDDSYCPVCGGTSQWRVHLNATIEEQAHLRDLATSWAQAIGDLRDHCDVVLEALLEHAEPARKDVLEEANDHREVLARLARVEGYATVPSRRAAIDLLKTVQSREFQEQADAAATRASAETAWLQALAHAMSPLREALLAHGESARQLPVWTGAQGKLRTLETDLKKSRQDALKTAANNTLEALLRDTGISMNELSVLRTKAEIGLRDSTDRAIELGMLSAGQRNALLLAPVLALAQSSPFGFFVLDDPVHAFDELRVDYVARQLTQAAQTRRLIVLTHDERLREHLLASIVDVDSRTIRRTPDTGVIELSESTPMWRTLLDDAKALHDLASSPQAIAGLTTSLRGLCRQAVDNALRLLVTRSALLAGEDSTSWLARLDGAAVITTTHRFRAARTLLDGTKAADRLDRARSVLQPFEGAWNRASHGNPPSPGEEVFDQVELTASRDACEELTR